MTQLVVLGDAFPLWCKLGKMAVRWGEEPVSRGHLSGRTWAGTRSTGGSLPVRNWWPVYVMSWERKTSQGRGRWHWSIFGSVTAVWSSCCNFEEAEKSATLSDPEAELRNRTGNVTAYQRLHNNWAINLFPHINVLFKSCYCSAQLMCLCLIFPPQNYPRLRGYVQIHHICLLSWWLLRRNFFSTPLGVSLGFTGIKYSAVNALVRDEKGLNLGTLERIVIAVGICKAVGRFV